MNNIGDLAGTPPLTSDEEEEVTQLYEERADHLELNAFQTSTALTTDSSDWIRALTGTGAKLVVGPRGCGKTHLMRFAFSECLEQSEHPFAVYTNLNRYYRLEPLLRRRPEAISMFYVWVLANVLTATHESIETFRNAQGAADIDPDMLLGFDIEQIRAIVGAYEQGRSLTDEQDLLAARVTIDTVKATLLRVTDALERRRVVLFLDDAALTLTPEYLSHFFDIYRALKSARIAPKASVYPGTTEYGANFHAAHEADTVFVWKAVTDANYLAYMNDIGQKRFPDMSEIQEDLRAMLAYAAFGVPRAYMTLVRSFNKARKTSGNVQSAFNRVIENFLDERIREYLTLRDKKPQLASIVSLGRELFDKIADSVADGNQALIDGQTRQLTIGVDASGINGKPYVDRMLRLLEEAGMLYKLPTVSHGDRDYLRFVPHTAALQARRAFSRRGAFSPKFTVELLQRPDEKHPVRRSMTTLLDSVKLDALGLDLPNCVVCGSKRVEGAKYCYSCGAKLTDESTYDRLMLTPLSDVPGLTLWQREKLSQSPSVPKTVGEFIALQDRGTALRTIRHIGRMRAKTVIDAVEEFLNEYLS